MRPGDTVTAFLFGLMIRILRLLKTGGTSLPGKLALLADRNILRNLSKGRKIIVVTGTNGKTTTSRMIAEMLKANGKTYFANRSGANLLSGITTAFIENHSSKAEYAVIETDEAAFPLAVAHFCPVAVVVTNFFRDQLDRYGELYSTLNKVKAGVAAAPGSFLILNGDDSLCASVGRESHNEKIYFGFSEDIKGMVRQEGLSDSVYCLYCRGRYEYSLRTIGHLGSFRCPSCGYEKPALGVYVSEILESTEDHTAIAVNVGGSLHHARIRLPAMYNVYNALAALALSKAIGLETKSSLGALTTFEAGFGRMERIRIGSRHIIMILVKNPAGMNSALSYLMNVSRPCTICFAINDRIADGRDISWLWDVDFEKLDAENAADRIICSGVRAYDMALRFKYMEMPGVTVTEDYGDMIRQGLEWTAEGSSFYILPTYTAMLDIRRILRKKYDLKEFWE